MFGYISKPFLAPKCAKIAIVNVKMGNYNSDKFKGAKLYTVNQNGAKVTSLLGRVKRTFSTRGPTFKVQYVDGALFFHMGLYFFR